MLNPSRTDQLIETLRDRIGRGDLPVGARLPSEQAMAAQFQVSRTVVREAVAQLKSDGLIETSQGRAAMVRAATVTPGRGLPMPRSIEGLLGFLEVRQSIEAEMAGFAAKRRTAQQCREIEIALLAIDAATGRGGNGVQEDLDFHLAIGHATSNLYWGQFVRLFADPMRSAIRVTRANEARRADFTAAVAEEHRCIYQAIRKAQPERARAAVRLHLRNAATRILQADRGFWQQEGGDLAQEWAARGLAERHSAASR